ncbi:MAG TPA: trypsin-like serine protease [Nannocystaceae bacterium]|nr:trypsin-like serine protease [Nannocystaceae bacterium]
MPRRILYSSLAIVFAPALALAAEPSLTDGTHPQHIYGGAETEQCAWPSVAYLTTDGAACTGTLIHPQIVLTAAHCLPGDASADVRFGERASTAVKLADTEFCKANPGFGDTGDGTDYGFCKLATPIDNIPVTPIAFGCEESVISPGRNVTHVGYGNDENGDSGRKKFVSLSLQNVTGNGELITGSNGDGICSGDSGGPVMVKLSAALGGDDSWRVIGIHSWAQMAEQGVCGGSAGSTLASRAIDFIETESGIDITPCFTAGGDWSPTWGCQGFPIDPGTGGEGSYNAMCETGPLAGFSAVCGAPLTDFPDVDPPVLEVVSPMGDQTFEVDGGNQAELHIEADANDGDGWGIAGVELQVVPEDGEMVTQTLGYAPYRWNTKFPAGGYNLKLIATDNAGNQTDSGWIAVGVGVAPPDTPPDGGDTSTGSDGGESTDDGAPQGDDSGDEGTGAAEDEGGQTPDDGGDAPRGGGSQGCAIAAASDVGAQTIAAWSFALFVGFAYRRKRG